MPLSGLSRLIQMFMWRAPHCRRRGEKTAATKRRPPLGLRRSEALVPAKKASPRAPHTLHYADLLTVFVRNDSGKPTLMRKVTVSMKSAPLRTIVPALAVATVLSWSPAWAQAVPAVKKPAKAAQPAVIWKEAYKAEFKDAKPGPEWAVLAGEASCTDGALVLKAAADGDGHIVLTTADCPGSVKMEFDGVLTGDQPCDMSPILNCGQEGHGSGYLLQFGGANNTKNRLRVARKIIKTTSRDTPLIEPGKKHHVVAVNEGGKVSLNVDGKPIFKYTDKQPLEGGIHSMVGFYTHGCTLTISNLVVSRTE